jgi:hypothetical protein
MSSHSSDVKVALTENFFRVAMNGDFRFLDIYLQTIGLLS